MPQWQMQWRGEVEEGARQVGLDVPDAEGVSGECLLTLDGRVWREELGSPPGVRVTVTVEPWTDAPPLPEAGYPGPAVPTDPAAQQEAS